MDAQLRLIPRPSGPSAEGTRAHRAATGGPARLRTRPSRSTAVAEAPAQWRIDESARERGRAGISQAREALRNARRPLPSEHHSTAA